MQVIWSRTAQTRFCGCKPCLNAASTLARQTTTAASKRRLKASDIFTACYSAMFATAALVDAKYKDDRRKQWDRAIAEVKAADIVTRTEDPGFEPEHAECKVELSNSEPRNVAPNKNFSIFDPYNQAIRLESPVTATLGEKSYKSLPERSEMPLEILLNILDSHMQLRTEVAHLKVKRGEFVHEMAQRTCEIKPLEPQTQVHLERMEQMVSRLVARLMLSPKSSSAQKNSAQVSPFRQDFKSEFKIMTDRVSALHIGSTQLPRYAFLSPGTMNASIGEILTIQALDSEHFDTVIAKICYNLLTSKAPPDINTYNIMLRQFTRLQQHNLVQAVIDSFFEDSFLRPDDLTAVAMLDYYAALRKKTEFNTIIQCMRGERGSMRAGGRRLVLYHSASQLQSWAKDRKVVHRGGYLYAKMPRSEPIFKSLILGSLRLFGAQRAIMYLKAAIREGHRISADVFFPIAQVCVAYRDKRRAATLLYAAVCQWHLHNMASEIECHDGVRRVIFMLMDLCGIELSISASAYGLLPRSPWKSEFRLFKEWLRYVYLKDVNFEHLEAKVKASEETISGLKIMLIRQSSRESTFEQMILSMLDLIHGHQIQWLRIDLEPLLATIEAALDESRASLSHLLQDFINIVYRSLPDYIQKKYDELMEFSPKALMERLQIILDLRLAAPEVVEQNITIVKKDDQVPEPLSKSQTEVGDISFKPPSFNLDSRRYSPLLGTGKWLVRLSDLGASPFS